MHMTNLDRAATWCDPPETARRAAPRPAVRTTVRLPITLADGRAVSAEMSTFSGLRDGLEHVALRLGRPAEVPLVRVHSECLTGDVFGSGRCDCGPQLDEALRRIERSGGWLLYMRQEGRGIGLYSKLDAYRLQELELDTFEANRALGRADDERDYGAAADMLRALGIGRIVLLSNNPDKRAQLEAAGIAVEQVLPTGVYLGPHNRQYLEAKVRHSSHTITLEPEGSASCSSTVHPSAVWPRTVAASSPPPATTTS